MVQIIASFVGQRLVEVAVHSVREKMTIRRVEISEHLTLKSLFMFLFVYIGIAPRPSNRRRPHYRCGLQN